MALKIKHFPIKAVSHVSGVIVGKKLNNIVLIFHDFSGNNLISITNKDLEKLGFIKIDLLSLHTLTLIKEIIEKINKATKTNLNFYDISYDDKKSIKTISDGYVVGIFQLEAKKETINLMKKNISNFYDIVYLISLYRPGSIKFIDNFFFLK